MSQMPSMLQMHVQFSTPANFLITVHDPYQPSFLLLCILTQLHIVTSAKSYIPGKILWKELLAISPPYVDNDNLKRFPPFYSLPAVPAAIAPSKNPLVMVSNGQLLSCCMMGTGGCSSWAWG